MMRVTYLVAFVADIINIDREITELLGDFSLKLSIVEWAGGIERKIPQQLIHNPDDLGDWNRKRERDRERERE